MRGIPEDKAVEIGERIDSCKYLECSVKEWLRDECQELQEPWMTLDESLKSGFKGWCWVYLSNKYSGICEYSEGVFKFRYGVILKDNITHVMPIHKPEPPKL